MASLKRRMEPNFLQTFWKLSSVEEEERIKAGEDLLTVLKKHQVLFERFSEPGCMPVLFQVAEEEGLSSELEYAVQRLVKGLSSNRKGARHGFYTVFTQVF